MRNYANHGYVVPAKDLGNLLTENEREMWTEMIEQAWSDGLDTERLQEWLSEHLPPASPVPFLFVLNDECESEDLEIGEIYAQYDEADLFEMVPSRYMQGLQARGVNPQNLQWVTFG